MRSARLDADRVVLALEGNFTWTAIRPSSPQVREAWPAAYRDALSHHEVIFFDKSGDTVLILGDAGTFDRANDDSGWSDSEWNGTEPRVAMQDVEGWYLVHPQDPTKLGLFDEDDSVFREDLISDPVCSLFLQKVIDALADTD